MRLNLSEIIEIPGGSVPFDTEMDVEGLDFPAIRAYLSKPHAVGRVVNEAGVLRLEGELTAELLCVCDPELFLLEGTEVDLDEILVTNFVLDMETKFLCREDCRGLCVRCGKNLNLGPCGCRKEIDPRFAVLEQLLDK